MSNTYQGANRWTRGAVSTGAGKSFAALSSSDPDVVALWNFDEASGTTITDVVNSEVLNITKGADFQDFLYDVSADEATDGGRLKNIVPGMTCSSISEYFRSTTLSATMDPGTSSFTIEMYCSAVSNANTNRYIAATYNTTSTTGFWIRDTSTGAIEAQVYATDGTSVQCFTSTGYTLRDGAVHHLRLEYDAGNTISIDLDGTTIQSVSAASLSGKTINFDELHINNAWVSTLGSASQWFQFRISHNATNNGYGLS